MPVSLVGLKLHLNEAGTESDGEIQFHLDAATRVVEDICGPLEPMLATELVTTATGLAVVRRYPVLSVETVQAGRAAPAGYVSPVPDRSNLDVGLVDVGRPGTYTVAYTAGRPDVPPNLELAAYIIAAQLWQTQRGQSVRPGIGTGRADSDGVPLGFAVPNRAAQLMQRDKQVEVR